MQKIAVLIPCYNEEATVRKVIEDFRRELPSATVYVYDNNSTDNTAREAHEAGAVVTTESRQGKGYVVRSMFNDIAADIYVMVDGDDTYPAEKVHEIIRPVAEGKADMVVGTRLHAQSKSHFHPLNRFGNKLFKFLINAVFRKRLTDVLSGYRAFNPKIVNMPILSKGFDIETELTMKALANNYRLVEVPVDLSPRAEGSVSKIRIIHDGILIFNTIFAILRDYKPLTAFGSIGLFLILCGLLSGGVFMYEYISTGETVRVPLALFSLGLAFTGVIVMFIGLVLHAVLRRFQELESLLHKMIKKL